MRVHAKPDVKTKELLALSYIDGSQNKDLECYPEYGSAYYSDQATPSFNTVLKL